MLVGRRTWRPPRRFPRWWQRGLSVAQRLATPVGWALSHLAALLSRDMRLLHATFSRRGLAVFPERPEHHYVPRVYGTRFYKTRSPLDDPEFMRDADEVLGQRRRTKLYYDRLHVLYQALHEVARTFPVGELRLLEGGAYRGGASFFLLRVAERIAPERTSLWAVDTFEGHLEEDMGAVREGGQTTAANWAKPFDASAEEVADYLSAFPSATVLKGRIQDVAESLPAEPIHLIHLDMNVYKPTVFGLELAQARLAPGGIVILDDYSNVNCPGVPKAVEDLLARERGRAFTKVVLPTGQCWLGFWPMPQS